VAEDSQLDRRAEVLAARKQPAIKVYRVVVVVLGLYVLCSKTFLQSLYSDLYDTFR